VPRWRGVGSRYQAEDPAGVPVNPVPAVVDAELAPNPDIRLVCLGDVVTADTAPDPVHVHE
jgi:hypothetical protein